MKINKLKIILIYLIFFKLNFITLHAENIQDYQIENISLKESLTEYFSVEKIKNNSNYEYYKSDKFYRVELIGEKSLQRFDHISFHLKKGDKKYIIYEISGIIDYANNVNECYPKQKEIISELSSVFPNVKKFDSGRQKASIDKNSTYDRYDFILKDGSRIDVMCYDWSEKIGYLDHLSIGLNTKEFSTWLYNEAY